MNPITKLLLLLSVILTSTLGLILFRFYGKNSSLEANNPIITPSKIISTDELPRVFQKILVVYALNDDNSARIYKNLIQVCKLSKIHAEYVSIEKFNASYLQTLTHDDVFVVTTELVGNLPHAAIYSFVHNGGKMVFLTRNNAAVYHELAGINYSRGFAPLLKGLTFTRGFFPGIDSLDMTGSGMLPHSSIDLRCSDTVEMYAEAGGIPILWKNYYGKGAVVYLNSTLANTKGNRGLLLQVIALAPDYFVQTALNAKVVTIDDFPAPIKRGRDNVIHNYYLMDNVSFFRHIWWSSMYNMAKKYNLVYTGMLIGTYNLTVEPPFEQLTPDELDDIQYFGYKLLELRGEIGLHGYNHNSLVMKEQMLFEDYGYYPWPSMENMQAALQLTKKSIDSVLGPVRITAYVPPSNIMSPEGKKAIKAVFPELRVIGGLYTGINQKGILYQEFGPDPDIEGVYTFPRFSAGYIYSNEDMWTIYNGIAHAGLLNHFIHPDDVLDSNRSGDRTWKDLYSDIDKIFGEVHAHFPYLEPKTVTQAAEDYRYYEQMQVYARRENDILTLYYKNAALPVYHYFRLNGTTRVLSIEGGSIRYFVDKEHYRLYLLTISDKTVRIKLQ